VEPHVSKTAKRGPPARRPAGCLAGVPPAYRAAETAALLLLKGGDFFLDRPDR
jgi:hypothetical protein